MARESILLPDYGNSLREFEWYWPDWTDADRLLARPLARWFLVHGQTRLVTNN